MSQDLDTERPDDPSPLSRRRLIQHAGAAGAVTVAAGFALNAGATEAAAAAPRPEPDTPASHDAPRHTSGEAFVVRVVDARTGELDIFHGERHHRVRDPKLTAELLRAAR
ncbi:hypothetical protein [Streptacidiphilus fuscans]|uniref:Secreted protein n=1 Tax=Streptacidiphilus fuscans TaxID=2789292 RepID=A0A931FCA7_9ACTN|nr:hypothetical protein [Streptacidiphilus fuscans]MBF9066980.1 hypothetical protein [Streptacidiphilus fuscans]